MSPVANLKITLKTRAKIAIGKRTTIPPINTVWTNDQLSGPVRIYYPSGKLKAEVNFKDGLMHDDPYKERYETGELYTKSTVILGKREGPFEEYYKGGAVKREGVYKNGLEEGVFKNYSELGYVRFDDFYEDGVLLHRRKYDNKGKVVGEKFFYPQRSK